MKKRILSVVALGAAGFLVAGGLMASNMGFKLNYQLLGPGSSASGTNFIALPANKMSGLVDAKDVLDDINTSGVPAGSAINLQRLIQSTDSLEVYDGLTGTAFTLTDGVGYFLQASQDANYIVVGSHNPGLSVAILGPGSSASGTNDHATLYHTTAADAKDLIDDLETDGGAGSITNVQKFLRAIDTFEVYDGLTGTAFTWGPGDATRIQANSDFAWSPEHF